MTDSEKHSRQTFLGPQSEELLAKARVAIFGLGGGGSHIAQQLAHVGIGHFVLFDPDRIERSNLNRTVGATTADVAEKPPTAKVEIAERLIRGISETSTVEAFRTRWQEHADSLKDCSVIFGAVDGLRERSEIEVFARAHRIPYVDIGLGVRQIEGEPPRMAGQVFLSLPDQPCLRCYRLLTEAGLDEEGARYGDAGPRPQVVWANGMLASAAVGIAIDLITGWTKEVPPVYLSYDGNKNTLAIPGHIRHLDLSAECPHFPRTKPGWTRL